MGACLLDASERLITALDNSLICEVALGGSDTTARVNTVWQVKILPIKNSNGSVNCDSSLPEWDELVAPPTGTMNLRTQPNISPVNICSMPHDAGYQSLENQLYRFEIQDPGIEGEATFKWSRDNAAIVAAIEKISGQEITVSAVGPYSVLDFIPGGWVEISDDAIELNRIPGQMVQIDQVDQATRIITLKSSPESIDMALNPKIRKWDSATVITVPADSTWIKIECGIEVQFSGGTYSTADYWTAAARTITG